jgi:cellulose synthase/poly-beta-1,6-N-acetylglucosamine synthase-like glycosyltransferase
MITVLITAFRESQTIGKALDAFCAQLPPGGEILVVCPDAETTAVIQQYAQTYPFIRHLADLGQGKPAALNIGFEAARGDVIVLSDGDVTVCEGALPALLAPFADPAVGAVTGRPVSISPRETKLGYWSHLLVEAAHQTRLARDKAGAFLLCSGYLFTFRRSLIDHIPEDALAEDAVISHRIAEQGHRIRYVPAAQVLVKYPTTYQDWLRQKVRSAGGYAQNYIRRSPFRMRSIGLELRGGTWLALRYATTLRELWWTKLLFGARLHLWGLVYWQIRIRKRPLSELWQRVETTK